MSKSPIPFESQTNKRTNVYGHHQITFLVLGSAHPFVRLSESPRGIWNLVSARVLPFNPLLQHSFANLQQAVTANWQDRTDIPDRYQNLLTSQNGQLLIPRYRTSAPGTITSIPPVPFPHPLPPFSPLSDALQPARTFMHPQLLACSFWCVCVADAWCSWTKLLAADHSSVAYVRRWLA